MALLDQEQCIAVAFGDFSICSNGKAPPTLAVGKRHV